MLAVGATVWIPRSSPASSATTPTGEVRAGVATGDVPLGDDAVWLTAHDDLVIYRLPTA
jgi:hypothetical protein